MTSEKNNLAGGSGNHSDKPLVSVVIPCYNQAQYLSESITSVLDSYHGPIEIIVVNDGSTAPKTAFYLRAAEQLSPAVRVISQANAGLSAARNTGISAAKGDFVQLLDSDDIIIPPKLDLQVAHFQVSREIDVSVTNFLLCDETRTIFSKHDEAIANFDFSLQDFLYKWERGFAIPIHCALFRTSALGDRPFDTSARAKEDWLFWCGLSARGARMAYLSAHHAIYRQHEKSMRRSYLSMGKSWLHAAAKIDDLVGAQEPAFFDSAVDWFVNFYRKHPDYISEVASLRSRSEDKATAVSVSDVQEADGFATKVSSLSAAVSKMKAVKPFISVVVPVFNHYDFLEECLASIVSQDCPIEIICVDDCSTDTRTSALLTALKGVHPNFRIVKNSTNLGISRTQNDAVAGALGEYVAFVDCDDALVSGALSRVRDVLVAEQSVDYLFTDRLDVNEKGDIIRRADYGGYETIPFKSPNQITDDLLDGMVASHLKVIRRSAYLSVGGSDDQYSGIQDWELALKLAQHGKFEYLREPLYRHRIHGGSVTRSDNVAQFRKTNVVRRRFTERLLRSGAAPGGHVVRYSSAAENLPTLAELKDAWMKGASIEFSIGADVPIPVLNFLREFNSYFDRITWSGPDAYAGLLGYLWSDVLIGPASQ
ncbi:glycosyl transferase family 2 [Burkholderia sp. MR1]|nr:glycosyl transferase family 2 [Burkholderia sp. MR1]